MTSTVLVECVWVLLLWLFFIPPLYRDTEAARIEMTAGMHAVNSAAEVSHGFKFEVLHGKRAPTYTPHLSPLLLL